jgi:hypothetical protein
MSRLNKYVQTEGAVIGQSFEVAAKSLKHMNDALMERVKESVDLIAGLRQELVRERAEHEETKNELDFLKEAYNILLLSNGKEESIEEGSGNPEERSREVSAVSEAAQKEEVVLAV